ncbi:MAG: site-specific integrase [Anaerolineae bacterium]|nr:site-specific integrase [Anaerolineae bacterium]
MGIDRTGGDALTYGAVAESWTGVGPNYRPLTRSGVQALIRRLALDVEASRPWSPHAIRHAVGHAYARAGIPVAVAQHKLGHSAPGITMQHYYPQDDPYLKQVSRRFSLLALQDEAPDEPATLKLVKKDTA